MCNCTPWVRGMVQDQLAGLTRVMVRIRNYDTKFQLILVAVLKRENKNLGTFLGGHVLRQPEKEKCDK